MISRRVIALMLCCSLSLPVAPWNGKNFWKGFHIGTGVVVGVGLSVLSASALTYVLNSDSKKSFSSDDVGLIDPQGRVTFNDIILSQETLVEIREYIDFLRNQDVYDKVGAKRPNGLLLYGPPGCGKTLVARAIASEGDCELISVAGSEFVNIYVGSGAANVRALFDRARALGKKKQVIIFIDEIDSLGKRQQTRSGGDAVYNGAINEILSQMDGFEKDNILVIGATNYIERLDSALLRPGRFDRKLYVPAPSRSERARMLELYFTKVQLDASLDIKELAKDFARKTMSFSGASLANFVNEAAILAAREKKEVVEKRHLEVALDKVILGVKNDVKQDKDMLKATAYHEAGHALIALLYDLPVHKVSIISRGNALGVTSMSEKYESLSHYKKSEILQMVCCTLGGFAAEKFMYGEVTPGVSSDLKGAGVLVSRMVNEFGMGDGDLEAVTWHAFNTSESVQKLDAQAAKLLSECLDKTKKLITKHQDLLHVIAKELLEHEEICEDRIYELADYRRGFERDSL